MRLLLKYSLILGFIFSTNALCAQPVFNTGVLIIGGGASGTTAAIQAARSGVKTLLVEETAWLGGMLTAAGVSAIDGNHKMPAGLWGEFREHLYDYYGGPAAVATGWVSNTLFEPHVGNIILKNMVAAEKKIDVWYQTKMVSLKKEGRFWHVVVKHEGKTRVIVAKILVDATESGDVMAAAGAEFRIGMDSRYHTGETQAIEKENNIIQDLTYVAVLKDYGKGTDNTITRPLGYDASVFSCSCDVSDPATSKAIPMDCIKMLQYGRLPNNKYMINWPKCGNDLYLNVISMNAADRARALEEAKLHTLRFVYYIQTELGYKNLGLADDEFPTADKLPMIPYYRESRRLKGLVTLTVNHIMHPYDATDALYRTGIAVGDYPIDHHHLKNPDAPKIDFIKMQVPSYNVPMGSLIPKDIDGLIVAEKSISVTNIVNGTTRLQPVVLQLGQAAGLMAARCVQLEKQPADLEVRDIQMQLLNARGYLMPFIDVPLSDPQFKIIQKIGATGIMRGTGVPYLWANQTWFYPEQSMSAYELARGLSLYYPVFKNYKEASGDLITPQSLVILLNAAGALIDTVQVKADLQKANISIADCHGRVELSRRAIALLIDKYLKPFEKAVSIKGQLIE